MSTITKGAGETQRLLGANGGSAASAAPPPYSPFSGPSVFSEDPFTQSTDRIEPARRGLLGAQYNTRHEDKIAEAWARKAPQEAIALLEQGTRASLLPQERLACLWQQVPSMADETLCTQAPHFVTLARAATNAHAWAVAHAIVDRVEKSDPDNRLLAAHCQWIRVNAQDAHVLSHPAHERDVLDASLALRVARQDEEFFRMQARSNAAFALLSERDEQLKVQEASLAARQATFDQQRAVLGPLETQSVTLSQERAKLDTMDADLRSRESVLNEDKKVLIAREATLSAARKAIDVSLATSQRAYDAWVALKAGSKDPEEMVNPIRFVLQGAVINACIPSAMLLEREPSAKLGDLKSVHLSAAWASKDVDVLMTWFKHGVLDFGTHPNVERLLLFRLCAVKNNFSNLLFCIKGLEEWFGSSYSGGGDFYAVRVGPDWWRKAFLAMTTDARIAPQELAESLIAEGCSYAPKRLFEVLTGVAMDSKILSTCFSMTADHSTYKAWFTIRNTVASLNYPSAWGALPAIDTYKAQRDAEKLHATAVVACSSLT